ncbi:MAG: ribosome maturation factor RimP [Elusimicrobiota bacterium]|nr:ribosome maturation factor RimP [Elusimicrobiota bacterium]
MTNKEKEIEACLSVRAKEAGFEIVDVEYVKEGRERYVRIYIDKDGGIDLGDCEKMSFIFGDILDDSGIIEESYILEISSPGLYRSLRQEKDFIRFIGSIVRIQTLVALDDQRNFFGTILSYDKGILKLEDKTIGEIEIEYSNIKKANIEPEL